MSISELEAFDLFHKFADSKLGNSGENDTLVYGDRVKHYSSENYGTVIECRPDDLYMIRWDEEGKVTPICARRYLNKK